MTVPQLCALLFLVFSTLLSQPCSAGEVRTWTTSDGRYSVDAELIEANDTEVTLKRADRTAFTISIIKLSQPDRDLVQAWLHERKQTEKFKPGIVPDVLGEPVDLLAMIDPAKDKQTGKWQRDANAIMSSGSSRARIVIPHPVSGSYQLRLVAQRQIDSGSLNIGLAVGNRHQVLAIFDYGRPKRSGLAWIDGKNEPSNSTFYRKPVFTTGRESEIVCTVHNSHLHITCDDKTIVDWAGDPSRLTLHPNFRVPSDRLFIETLFSSFRITELQYRSIHESELSRYKPRGKPTPAHSVALIEYPLGHGSGFLAAPNLLITNYHVIEDAVASELKIVFPEQRDSPKVHGVLFGDVDRDLAILSVQTQQAPLAVAHDGHSPIGDSVQLRGNPTMGSGVTLRDAVVKGTVRSMVRVEGYDFLQVDASIDSGSSGGPILNELDQVVGVIAMKATDEGEKWIHESLARLDDSFKNKPRQQAQQGIAFGIPGQDLVKALDHVRGLTAQQSGRNAQLHENRVVFKRLATLAGIRLLEANVNVPDVMRHQAARLNATRGADDLLELIPAEPARLLRAALQSEGPQQTVTLLQQNMDEHLKTIRSSPYLSQSTIRDFHALSQRIKAIEEAAERPGTDYLRFSAMMMRLQKDVTRLLSEVKQEL